MRPAVRPPDPGAVGPRGRGPRCRAPAAPAPGPWTAVLSVLVVGVLAAGLLRHLPSAAAREAAGRSLIALGPGVLALGATTALLETGPTLLAAVIAWSAILLVTAAMSVTVRRH